MRMPTIRNAIAVAAIISVAGILSILNIAVYTSSTTPSTIEMADGAITPFTTTSIVTAPPAASGSTGIRFSGDKVRVFNVNSNKGTGLLAVDSSHFGNKQKILFPSPSGPKDSDGGFGSEAACEQWAVVTTIHVPNPSINGVADLRNWCLVIVGDTITPDSAFSDLAKKDDVFYLSASYQKTLLTESRISFIEMMPFKSFARKNIGYLFAISNGAQVIFDFDDDNVLTPLEDGKNIPPSFFRFGNDMDCLGLNRKVQLKFINSAQQVGTTTKHQTDVRPPLAFNPYIFMGASHHNSWPRGFPIDQLQNNFVNGLLDTTEVGDLPYSSIGVIQSLCNGDPDNDAVFRMTRADSTNFTFERTAKSLPLLIPSNAYSPYNAQATTHLYNAFWGLYLPITVPGRVTDIWRSYITQRIMKDLGLHVMYTPPIVQHERSAHDYLSDFVAESDLYDKTTKLLEFLDGWSSDARKLPERIFELWVGLYEHDYLGLHDVEAAREWLNTLITIGYKFPSVIDSRASMVLPQIQSSKIDIVVMVMGELKRFGQWFGVLSNIEANLSFIYASYDAEIPEKGGNFTCEESSSSTSLDCQTMFIPHTTWTEGRNLLAQEALRKERGRGKEYSYWLFLDDDVEVRCNPQVANNKAPLSLTECWQNVFNFISSDEVPEKVSTITVLQIDADLNDGFVAFSNADALFAAFKRERVPYLLPYATLQEGQSQWDSQAAHFCLIGSCMASSVLSIPLVKGSNQAHREYVRDGFSLQSISATIARNYNDNSTGFSICDDWEFNHYSQEYGRIGPFKSRNELDQNIPDPKLEYCAPLTARFAEWEKSGFDDA